MIFTVCAYPSVIIPCDFIDQEKIRFFQRIRGYEEHGPIRLIEAEDWETAQEVFLDLFWEDFIKLGCHNGDVSIRCINVQ